MALCNIRSMHFNTIFCTNTKPNSHTARNMKHSCRWMHVLNASFLKILSIYVCLVQFLLPFVIRQHHRIGFVSWHTMNMCMCVGFYFMMRSLFVASFIRRMLHMKTVQFVLTIENASDARSTTCKKHIKSNAIKINGTH